VWCVWCVWYYTPNCEKIRTQNMSACEHKHITLNNNYFTHIYLMHLFI